MYIICACLSQVEEFSKEVNVDGVHLLTVGVFVIYEWKWPDVEHSHDSSSEEGSLNMAASSNSSMSPLPPHIPVANASTITHVVTFKCIGASRDKEHQKVLQMAYNARQRGEVVSVKIEPEPSNPYDSKAIAFICMVEGSWKRIGYVVREVVDEVHKAAKQQAIFWVKFAWIKYLVQWTRCGPGFYAGINIARKGEWSNTCIKSASTR